MLRTRIKRIYFVKTRIKTDFIFYFDFYVVYFIQNKKNEIFYSYENKFLPTWKTKNNIIKYTLPSELQHLTLAEKLLIQRVSPLVPVIHIKNGILGIRGHVVSFFQDIS